jgi:hypothetical protein
MSIFEEVGLTWRGEEYVVPPEKVMELCERVLSILPAQQMHADANPAVVARAFSTVLRFAGVESKFLYVDDDGNKRYSLDSEVYAALFDSDSKDSIYGTLHSLQKIIIPPHHLQRVMKSPGKPQATRPKNKARRASSRKRT